MGLTKRSDELRYPARLDVALGAKRLAPCAYAVRRLERRDHRLTWALFCQRKQLVRDHVLAPHGRRAHACGDLYDLLGLDVASPR